MDKALQATFDEKTKRPIIEIEGDWAGRDIKLLMKMLPRAYRIYKVEKLKQLAKEKQKSKEGVSDVTTGKRKERKQPAA